MLLFIHESLTTTSRNQKHCVLTCHSRQYACDTGDIFLHDILEILKHTLHDEMFLHTDIS